MPREEEPGETRNTNEDGAPAARPADIPRPRARIAHVRKSRSGCGRKSGARPSSECDRGRGGALAVALVRSAPGARGLVAAHSTAPLPITCCSLVEASVARPGVRPDPSTLRWLITASSSMLKICLPVPETSANPAWSATRSLT